MMDSTTPPRLEQARPSTSPYSRSPRRCPPSLKCEKLPSPSKSPSKSPPKRMIDYESRPSTSTGINNNESGFDVVGSRGYGMVSVSPKGSVGSMSPKRSLAPTSPKRSLGPMSPKRSLGPMSPKRSLGPVSPIGSMGPTSPSGSLGPMSPRGSWYQVGMTILARWTDGLVYLGTIEEVRSEDCYVKFEDNSQHWVLFKDIQKASHEDEDISCSVCDSGISSEPNEIVICDTCEAGFHQKCHQPEIDMSVVQNEEKFWSCRECIFANSAKVGGASKRGIAAKVYEEVKKSLPYKLEDLTWDVAHRSNVQRCYCYCGGPGEWYLKMLQCCRCLQWFHEACVQCINMPMIYGDIFYLFVCSMCNYGPEYLQRLPLKWSDVAHLVLYNLTLKHKKKYYDFIDDIMPYLTENWYSLQVPHLASATRAILQDNMNIALQSSKTKISCGREIRKRVNLFGLRIRSPPNPPTIEIPDNVQITEAVMRDMQMKGRKIVKFKSVSPPPPDKKKRGRKKKIIDAQPPVAAKKQASSPTKGQGMLDSHQKNNITPRSILDTIESFPIVYKRDNVVPGRIPQKKKKNRKHPASTNRQKETP